MFFVSERCPSGERAFIKKRASHPLAGRRKGLPGCSRYLSMRGRLGDKSGGTAEDTLFRPKSLLETKERFLYKRRSTYEVGQGKTRRI